MARPNYRKSARIARGLSLTFFILAAVFAILGVALLVATGKPTNVLTILMALIMALNAFRIGQSARELDRSADILERI